MSGPGFSRLDCSSRITVAANRPYASTEPFIASTTSRASSGASGSGRPNIHAATSSGSRASELRHQVGLAAAGERVDQAVGDPLALEPQLELVDGGRALLIAEACRSCSAPSVNSTDG